MRTTFGARGFFGFLKVPSGEVYWFENHAQPVEPERAALDAIPEAQYRQRLVDLHHDDHAPITEIIAATESRIGRYPSYDIPSLPTRHSGPVCLIGDAAHAALPSAGQGASLAFADAIVLARCLRDVPEVTRALATFGSLRRERVEKVVEQARRTSGQKGPTNAVSRAVRDQVLPFFLKLAAGQARKAAAFRVDWDERVVPAGEPPPAASLRPGSGVRGSRPRRPARRPSP